MQNTHTHIVHHPDTPATPGFLPAPSRSLPAMPAGIRLDASCCFVNHGTRLPPGDESRKRRKETIGLSWLFNGWLNGFFMFFFLMAVSWVFDGFLPYFPPKVFDDFLRLVQRRPGNGRLSFDDSPDLCLRFFSLLDMVNPVAE